MDFEIKNKNSFWLGIIMIAIAVIGIPIKIKIFFIFGLGVFILIKSVLLTQFSFKTKQDQTKVSALKVDQENVVNDKSTQEKKVITSTDKIISSLENDSFAEKSNPIKNLNRFWNKQKKIATKTIVNKETESYGIAKDNNLNPKLDDEEVTIIKKNINTNTKTHNNTLKAEDGKKEIDNFKIINNNPSDIISDDFLKRISDQ